jgi:hypothetical protein
MRNVLKQYIQDILLTGLICQGIWKLNSVAEG